MKYDATLRNWSEVTIAGITVVYGNIYGDSKKRFRDGDRVRTSRVSTLDRTTNILVTKNTTYKLDTELTAGF
jgi:hypothetical protein